MSEEEKRIRDNKNRREEYNLIRKNNRDAERDKKIKKREEGRVKKRREEVKIITRRKK